LQAKQVWPQLLSQQTPSTQRPVAHWDPAVQPTPSRRLTVQRFASQ
jgi:hypothetical protein